MPALQISCAKPDCHWVGAPADAATHLCPTPADGEAPATLDIMGTFEAVSGWLLEHGEFDDAGEPLNEETRLAGDRLTQLAAADAAADGQAYEPDLDLTAEPAAEENAAEPTWEQRIRDEIQTTDNPAKYRWAVVGHPADPDAPPVLLGLHAIKASADQELELQADYDGEATPHRVSDLLKTAAEHDLADELERDDDAAGSDEAPEPDAIQPEDGATPEEAAGGEEQPTGEVGEQPDTTSETGASDEEAEPEEQAGDLASLGLAAQEIADERSLTLNEATEAAGNVLQLPPPVTPAAPVKKPRKAKAADAPAGEADGGALFDAADYETEDLAIPKVDGSSIDRIAIDVSGGVMLDRSNPQHVELYNRVHMRKSLELWVTAVGSGVGAKPATNRDGETDIIVGRKGLRVDAIRVVEPEQLGAVEGLELVRAAARKAARGGATHDQIEAATVAALAELDD